jgi:hypothetical protein
MKQPWLIEPLATTESMSALELDSHTLDKLVALMATAIESIHGQQLHSPEQAKEAPIDEPSTTALQNPRRTLEP